MRERGRGKAIVEPVGLPGGELKAQPGDGRGRLEIARGGTEIVGRAAGHAGKKSEGAPTKVLAVPLGRMEKAPHRRFGPVAEGQECADHAGVKPRPHLSLDVGDEEKHGEKKVEAAAGSKLVQEETPLLRSVAAFEERTVASEPVDQILARDGGPPAAGPTSLVPQRTDHTRPQEV